MLVCGNKPDNLSGTGNYGCVQVDVTAIGQNEFMESDSQLVCGTEVSIQCVECSRSAWDGENGRYLAGCYGTDGNDETVEDIDGLHHAP